ncbi:major outer membrane protein, partial [Campylobacter fetus]|nr:major outer membrane protein [Campylobacter fetus]
MKLVKMSLAAIVAAGALTSVASATPLEEAIKNVDVSGFAMYRFDSAQSDMNGKDTKASHRFTSYVDFKTALDDNFFAVLGLRYDSKDVSGDHITGGQTQVGVNDAGAED